MNNKRNHGTTLVEAMVATALLALIGGAMIMVVLQAQANNTSAASNDLAIKKVEQALEATRYTSEQERRNNSTYPAWTDTSSGIWSKACPPPPGSGVQTLPCTYDYLNLTLINVNQLSSCTPSSPPFTSGVCPNDPSNGLIILFSPGAGQSCTSVGNAVQVTAQDWYLDRGRCRTVSSTTYVTNYK